MADSLDEARAAGKLRFDGWEQRPLHRRLRSIGNSRWAFAVWTAAPISQTVVLRVPSQGPTGGVADSLDEAKVPIASTRPRWRSGRRGSVTSSVLYFGRTIERGPLPNQKYYARSGMSLLPDGRVRSNRLSAASGVEQAC